MKISTEKIFKISFNFITAIAAILFIISKLPASTLLYECKNDPPVLEIKYNDFNTTPQDKQAFCQQGYHPEVKDSLGQLNSNIVSGLFLTAILVVLPSSAVLISRRLHQRS